MRYVLDPDRSTLVIEARSSLGAIEWQTQEVDGEAALTVGPDGAVMADPPPTGEVTIDLMALVSGNSVYDGELLRRIDGRRFPEATVELGQISLSEPPTYHLSGRLTFHGQTRALAGVMDLTIRDDGTLLVVGQHEIDIRDFDVPAPTMLMLKIYPDVAVNIVAVLTPTGS